MFMEVPEPIIKGSEEPKATNFIEKTSEGISEVVIEEVEKKKSLIDRLNEIGTIPQKDIIDFTRHMSVMISAGVTVFETLEFLIKETKNKVFKSKLKIVLKNLNNGQSFSSSISKFPKIFPSIYVNIVRVGEESGTLPSSMKDLADSLEESAAFKRKVKGALIYPKIIGLVMFGFMMVLALFVMPRILKIFESLDAEIPFSTRVIIWLTGFINDYFLLIIAIIVGFLVFIHYIFKNKYVSKKRDLFYLKTPMFGRIVLNYNVAQITHHFNTLFASGITIVKCLDITKNVINNQIFQEEIDCMIDKIKNGSSLSESFRENSYFPSMIIKLFKVGERTGKLQDVIDYVSKYYHDLVDNDVKDITTIIEPVIMIVLGLMVAGLIITVIGPIYQLISNVAS